MDASLKKLWNEVTDAELITIDSIEQGLRSGDFSLKMKSIFFLRRIVEEGNLTDRTYNIAVECLDSNTDDSMWQAVCTLDIFLWEEESRKQEIWELILKYGSSKNEDVRGAVGTILLENYFDKHNYPKDFDTKFPELTDEIRKGNQQLLKTLSICYANFGSEKNDATVETFLMSHYK